MSTQAISTSYKVEVMNGHHAFGTSVVRAGTGADTLKAALFLATATLSASTTTYTTTNEVSDASYTAGGITVTNATAPSSSGTTAFWTPSANFAWTNLTATAFDTVHLYNSTQSNKSIAVFTFGSQTVTAANFTLNMPTNNSTTALIRLA